MGEFIVCKLCLMMKGLNGIDLANGTCTYAFSNEDELIKHLKVEHHLIIKDKDVKKNGLKGKTLDGGLK